MNKNRNNQEPIHICAIKNRAEIFQLILSRSYQPTSALVPLLFEVMQIIITFVFSLLFLFYLIEKRIYLKFICFLIFCLIYLLILKII